MTPDRRNVAVVVTTYCPDPMVSDLLAVLTRWDGPVIVVDDGSPEPFDPGPVTEWIRLGSNRGVAAALNEGVRCARGMGATHVVTFDQDSLVGEDYLEDLVRAWGRARAQGLVPGVVAPRDPGQVRYRGTRVGEFLCTTEVVQSGAMFSLAQLAEIGDFEEALVIDGVDSHACLLLGERGFDILCVDLSMAHQLGDAVGFDVGSRRILMTGHAASRHYYMTRNRLLLAREHAGRRPGWAVSTIRKAAVGSALTLLLDDDRMGKGAAIARGVRDGVFGGRLSGRRGPSPLP